jgi:hypothetical protein
MCRLMTVGHVRLRGITQVPRRSISLGIQYHKQATLDARDYAVVN